MMGLAKISVATYTKCMHQLHTYGYVTYLPSYNPITGSTIYLHFKNRINLEDNQPKDF